MTYKEIKKSLATGELRHPDNYPRQENDMSEDKDSDESVGKIHKKKFSKRYIMSTSEGQFIINLPVVLGCILVFMLRVMTTNGVGAPSQRPATTNGMKL